MKSSLSYRNKKSTLVKKAYELSVLCNVPVCILIYPSNNNIQQKQLLQEAEVYAFEGGDKTRPATESDPATVSKLAGEIVGCYLACPNNRKRSLNLSDVQVARKKFRARQEVACDTSNYKNNKSADMSELSSDQLVELLGNLDHKIDYVRRRIDMIKGTNNNAMVPNFMMGINDNHDHHHGLMGVDYDGEFADDQAHQGPGFAYGFGGVYNNNINMLMGTNDNHDHHHHGLMGVDYDGEFADDQPHQWPGFAGVYNNNMNIVCPNSYDQGSRFDADNFFSQSALPVMMFDNQIPMVYY